LDIPKPDKNSRKRQPKGDPGSSSYLGPWAAYEEDLDPEILTPEIPIPSIPSIPAPVSKSEPSIDDQTSQELVSEPQEPTTEEPDEGDSKKPAGSSKRAEFVERTTFHGKERLDYLGRSYLHPPTDLKAGEHDCFLPKKKIHTWSGHNKGVSAIELFPNVGHLLLSADLDGKVKIWDVYNKRRVLRTVFGHNHGVTAINFSPDGSRFLTASLDRTCKLWDTETGLCIRRFPSKVPHCVKFYPEDPNIFVAGCVDKRIVQVWFLIKMISL
jgi:pre-mRNA-processing factor 17